MTSGRLRGEAIAAAVVFCLTATTATVLWQVTGDAVTDIPLYRTYGERIADGLVPYRDFGFEYPPLALPALVLPALVTETTTAFRIAFGAEMALVGAVGVLLVAELLRRLRRSDDERRVALTAVALLPLLLGGVILTRFDLVPAALVAAALAALPRGTPHGRRGRARPRDRREALARRPPAARRGRRLPPAAGAAPPSRPWRSRPSPVVVLYLPFLVVGPDGVLDSFGRQLGRPLQIESLGAGALLALHHVAGVSLEWSSSAGSQNLDGAAAGTLAVLLAIAQVAAVALVWVVHARGPVDGERLVRHAAAAVVAFVAFSKVLSPQFLVWLLPPRAARRRRERTRRRSGSWRPRARSRRCGSPRSTGSSCGSSTRSRRSSCSPRGATLVALLCRAHVAGQGTRTGSIALARPVAGSQRDEGALEAHAARGRLEPHGHPRPHAADRELARDADHRVVRAGHPDVGERRRAAREDARVRGLDVRVRPEHRRDAAVEPGGQGDLLARRLRVDVDDHDRRGGARLLDERVDDLPHALSGIEEERAEQVEDGDRRAVARGDDREAAARRSRLEVGRADDGGRRRQVRADLLAPPGVVPEGEGVRPCREQPLARGAA